MGFSVSAKNILRIFAGIVLNLSITVSIDILTVLVLAVHEREMCFRSFLFCDLSHQCFVVFFTRLASPWFSELLFFSVAVVNGNVFLLFSGGSLSVCRNRTDFLCVYFVSCYFAELIY